MHQKDNGKTVLVVADKLTLAAEQDMEMQNNRSSYFGQALDSINS